MPPPPEEVAAAAIRLFDVLPAHPVVTVPRASGLLGTTAPPARKAIDLLTELGVLRETTGKQRDRASTSHAYRDLLTESAAP